jgi:hypothetical protein
LYRKLRAARRESKCTAVRFYMNIFKSAHRKPLRECNWIDDGHRISDM